MMIVRTDESSNFFMLKRESASAREMSLDGERERERTLKIVAVVAEQRKRGQSLPRRTQNDDDSTNIPKSSSKKTVSLYLNIIGLKIHLFNSCYCNSSSFAFHYTTL